MNDVTSFVNNGFPFFLSALLGLIYKKWDNPDGTSSLPEWKKAWIAAGTGMLFGILTLIVQSIAFTGFNIIMYVIWGFLQGCAAIGVYKVAQKTPGVPVGPQ